jgi:c-di-GMP-binding flagellar brake protein YcgR
MQERAQQTSADLAERRAEWRRKSKFEVRLNFSFRREEETQIQFRGVSCDFSPSGMKVMVEGMSQSMYRRILSDSRMVSINVDGPDERELICLPAKIVWIDFHTNPDTGGEGNCFLGLNVETKSLQSARSISR